MASFEGSLAAVAAVAAAAALTGCGDSSSPSGEAAASPTPTAHRCVDRPGGLTDLSDGGWRSSSGRRWSTTDGCWVRWDVVADFDGPAHCEWQAKRAIVVSEPVGRRFRGPRTAARYYVRDPENALDDAATAGRLDVDAVLPGAAADTGAVSPFAIASRVPGRRCPRRARATPPGAVSINAL